MLWNEKNIQEAAKCVEALAPMCHLGAPTWWCTDEELYYRRHHRYFSEVVHGLNHNHCPEGVEKT
jgi:hypothetical protein